MKTRKIAACLILSLAVMTTLVMMITTVDAQRPKQNIAHRGASAYAPEHTLAAYQLAIDQRADFVEQDLAVTRDGELICLHDDTLERTTNAEIVFPDRGVANPGGRGGAARRWIANDFTLAEIKKLDAGEWFDAKYSGARVPTFQEAIDLVRGKAGMYPELKSPPLYTSRGVDMVALFVVAVKKNGLDREESLKTTPLIVQSFDESTVQRLARELPTVPRIWLMGGAPEGGLTPERLTAIAKFATGIGPSRNLIADDPGVVARAHAAGLTVTAYTFAARASDPPAVVRDEMAHFLHTLGGDALFTNNPDRFPRIP